MADKRMFSKQIIDSDAFLDMPLSAQALYFHLNMRADDDGFINSPKKIQRLINCSEDDLKLLIAKRFVIKFDSGVVVIKHWLIHNYLRKDTYKPTNYIDEKSMLYTKTNKSYTLNPPSSTVLLRECDETVPQIREDKISKDKNSIDNINLSFIDDSIDKVKLTQEQYDKLINKFSKDLVHKTIISLDTYIANGTKKYKDHYRTLNNWCTKNNKEAPKVFKSTGDDFNY
ncbi:replisome organizer [Clostridium sp. YIM B02500]|uniref:replisome organizer n=1 Tax=Clostridium sp. YIM B02500 TaxID=2910681 RepID=UPI001EED0738|nr:replisome organizer [Clostridium sp. YIM B02500]